MNKYSDEQKQEIIERYTNGKSAAFGSIFRRISNRRF